MGFNKVEHRKQNANEEAYLTKLLGLIKSCAKILGT